MSNGVDQAGELLYERSFQLLTILRTGHGLHPGAVVEYDNALHDFDRTWRDRISISRVAASAFIGLKGRLAAQIRHQYEAGESLAMVRQIAEIDERSREVLSRAQPLQTSGTLFVESSAVAVASDMVLNACRQGAGLPGSEVRDLIDALEELSNAWENLDPLPSDEVVMLAEQCSRLFDAVWGYPEGERSSLRQPLLRLIIKFEQTVA